MVVLPIRVTIMCRNALLNLSKRLKHSSEDIRGEQMISCRPKTKQAVRHKQQTNAQADWITQQVNLFSTRTC